MANKLRDLIGDRPPTRNDWHLLADAWGLDSDYTLQEVAPEGVGCATCWSWLLCAECLGQYPTTCPACEGSGLCHCQDSPTPKAVVGSGVSRPFHQPPPLPTTFPRAGELPVARAIRLATEKRWLET